MKHITVDIESAAYGKCNGEGGVDTRHFDEICRELGITYEGMIIGIEKNEGKHEK